MSPKKWPKTSSRLAEAGGEPGVVGLVRIYAEDCDVGNVSISETFRGHES